MNRHIINLVKEPQGELFVQMIRVLADYSTSVLLVVRDNLGLDRAALELQARIHPHLIETQRSSSWPGTELINESAFVYKYSLSELVVDELVNSATRLYGWQQPSLPEDLALLRSDGSTLFGSVTHEQDAFLMLSAEEYGSLINRLPGLVEIIGGKL